MARLLSVKCLSVWMVKSQRTPTSELFMTILGWCFWPFLSMLGIVVLIYFPVNILSDFYVDHCIPLMSRLDNRIVVNYFNILFTWSIYLFSKFSFTNKDFNRQVFFFFTSEEENRWDAMQPGKKLWNCRLCMSMVFVQCILF